MKIGCLAWGVLHFFDFRAPRARRGQFFKRQGQQRRVLCQEFDSFGRYFLPPKSLEFILQGIHVVFLGGRKKVSFSSEKRILWQFRAFGARSGAFFGGGRSKFEFYAVK